MQEIFNKLGINPKNVLLYEQAFIHTSYAHENNLDYSYETLEFLGDAALDLIVSDYLYKEHSFQEGEMTKIRASYVCENALYEYAIDLGFSDFVKLGQGEINTGGNHKKAILADIFEAFIAAIYLDLGYEKAKEVALNIIVPYIENKDVLFLSDYKSELQEVVQDLQKSLSYILLEEEGPAHNKRFKMAVKIDDIIYGEGIGHTKKEAEQEAAKSALMKLVKNK
jgi:ribonuclease-3